MMLILGTCKLNGNHLADIARSSAL